MGRAIHEATSNIPIVADGDNGHGNAVNVKRTVSQFQSVGFAGVLIEDQVSPKSCGHVGPKKVCSREEAVQRVRAACHARDENPGDIVIFARTDACQAVSFEEAMARVQLFAEAGADVLFVDALESQQQMRTFAQTAPGVFKMASMLEGGGKTPICSPAELQTMGFHVVAYPLSLLGAAVKGMQNALEGLKEGRVPVAGQEMASLQELKDVLKVFALTHSGTHDT